MLESGGVLNHFVRLPADVPLPVVKAGEGRPQFHLPPANHHKQFQTSRRNDIKDALWEVPPLPTNSWNIFHPHAPWPCDAVSSLLLKHQEVAST